MIFFLSYLFIFSTYIFDGSFSFQEIHRLYKTQKRDSQTVNTHKHKQTMAVLGRLVRAARTWRTVASPKTLIPSPPRSRDLPRRLYHRTLLYLFTSIIIITLFIFLFLFQNSFNYIFNSLNLFGVIVIALNVWFVSIFFFFYF